MQIHPISWRTIGRSALGATLLSAALISAANSPDNPGEELARVKPFALGYVGFIGHISAEERLYRRVQGSADALATFTTIIRSRFSTPEAKAYAACGLRHADRALFDRETSHLRTSNAEVSVLRADLLRQEPLTDLIGHIEKHGCS